MVGAYQIQVAVKSELKKREETPPQKEESPVLEQEESVHREDKSIQMDEVEKDMNLQCQMDYGNTDEEEPSTELMPQRGQDGGIGVQTSIQTLPRIALKS